MNTRATWWSLTSARLSIAWKGNAMAETVTKDGMVTWIKEKYSCHKDKGRYKGGTSTGGKPAVKRKKVGGGPSPIERVKVIGADGHVRWETRPRAKR